MGSLKIYDDFGKGLHLEYGYAPLTPVERGNQFHMHPQYELLLVWDENVNETTVNGRVLSIDHPMAVLTAPYVMHHTYFKEAAGGRVERCVLYFDESFLADFAPCRASVADLLGNANAALLNLKGHEDWIRELVGVLVRLGGSDRGRTRVPANENQRLMAGVIFGALLETTGFADRGLRISEQNYITDVTAYIARNLESDLTIAHLADRFFISRDKLCRDFRRYMDMNVGDFVSTARLNLAKRYLSDGSLTVKEISARCGFENDVYFYAFFKKHEGCTPKEFMRQKMSGRQPHPTT